MTDIILDAFLDSLKVLAAVAVCTYIIAFIEPLLAEKIKLKGKFATLIGVSVSLLPQCGFSVVAADLYRKRHITVGTLIGVFIATSDEALPIFLSHPDTALHILPFLAAKFALGLVFGYLIDFILIKSRNSVEHHVEHCSEEYKIRLMHCDSAELAEKVTKTPPCDCVDCADSECRHLHSTSSPEPKHFGILSDYSAKFAIKTQKREKVSRFVIKPFLHSIEIFVFVLVVNIVFGIIIHFVGEDKIISFLGANKYIAPFFSVIIGAIPNCVSSIVLSELYIMGGLGFGATLGGLCMNAGLGFLLLFKDIKFIKRNLCIFAALFCISIIVSYLFSLIFSFGTLIF